ncbi:MAG: DUF4363 family protein [Eubacteriales bacterium]
MKGFIITSVLFIIMIVLIGANCAYVNNVADSLLGIVLEISPSPSKENQEIINELQEKFQSSKMLLGISISTKDIESLSDCIDSVSSANKAGDEARLPTEIELLKNAIETIRKLERFSVDNII